MNQEQVIEVLKFMGFKLINICLFKLEYLGKDRSIRLARYSIVFRNFRGTYGYPVNYSKLTPEYLNTLLEEFLDVEREK